MRDLALVPGDLVQVSHESGEYFATALIQRRNLLSRSYRGDERPIAANIDHLFIVGAVPPLLKTLSIDRMAVVAHQQSVPWSLVVNKIDLGTSACDKIVELYSGLGVPVYQTAAKFGLGLELFQDLLLTLRGQTLALCGISGVGKSTLLNAIAPEAARVTADVSEKSGQGRQTTTHARGILFHPVAAGSPTAPQGNVEELSPEIVMIDLPGIQQFGVEHLTVEDVRAAFHDIMEVSAECEFSNCSHVKEEKCAVRAAVASGRLSLSRFESFVHMCQELEAAKPY